MTGNRFAPAVVSNPILRACMGEAVAQLRGVLAAAMSTLDDDLFDLAERAADNTTQARYFACMREMRKCRATIENEFLDRVRAGFVELSSGSVHRRDDRASADAQPDSSVAAIIKAAEAEYGAALDALGRRLGVLVGRCNLPLRENPLSPGYLTGSFWDCCRAIGVNELAEPRLLTLWQEFVLDNLDELYAELNRDLASAEVLPGLAGLESRRDLAATAASGESGSHPPAPAGEPATRHHDANLAPSSGNRGMDRGKRGTAGPETAAGVREGETVAGGADVTTGYGGARPAGGPSSPLLTALGKLHAELCDGQGDGDEPVAEADSFAGRLEKLVRSIDEDVHLDGETRRIINLVGAEFDALRKDPDMADAVRPMLEQIQVPYLHGTLIDPELADNPRHPARRLLHCIVEVIRRWSLKEDPDGKLFLGLQTAVERIAESYGKAGSPLQAMHHALQYFEHDRENEAPVAENRTTETTKGRERLLAAKEASRKAVEPRLEDARVPEFIHDLIAEPWANVLVLHYLRFGPGSREWNEAEAFLDDLIWTGQPKVTAADVARLQSMLPGVSERLRSGLEMVAFQGDDIQEVFEALKESYRNLLSEQYRDKLHMPSVRSATPLRHVAHLHAVELPEVEGAADTGSDSGQIRIPARIREEVRKLQRGTWLEFTDASGGKVRAKLSWNSPITRKYLFVGEQGTKIADKTEDELAAEIARGETLILDSTPIFDRAMGSIVGRSGRPRDPRPGGD